MAGATLHLLVASDWQACLVNLYEMSVPEKVLEAWAAVSTISLAETRKNTPPDENEYEPFPREYKDRLQRLRTVALGTAATAQAIPESIQTINALWRLGLEHREQTRLINFINDDVKKDLFKLTMPELERVVRLALSQNRELTELYGRGRRSQRQQAYWNDSFIDEHQYEQWNAGNQDAYAGTDWHGEEPSPDSWDPNDSGSSQEPYQNPHASSYYAKGPKGKTGRPPPSHGQPKHSPLMVWTTYCFYKLVFLTL